MATTHTKASRAAFALPVAWFLGIEFIDELVDGYLSAAWPAIKSDLHLSLTQIGLLAGVPRFLGNILEMPLGIMADLVPRWRLITAGGLAFSIALFLHGAAPGFAVLMVAFLLFNPASCAFVSISQASLMDMAPRQREVNMARWSLAGTLGNLAGPLILTAAVAIGVGWRPAFWLIAIFAIAAVVAILRTSRAFAARAKETTEAQLGMERFRLTEIVRSVWRQGAVRWLILLESSDLLLDVFRGFLALYMVEVAMTGNEYAALTVMALTAGGLVGCALMVPLLKRFNGVSWLRISAGLLLLAFPAFLVTSLPPLKVALVVLIGLLTSGWYSVLKAGLYAQLPGRSGMAMAAGSIGGLVGALIPIALGYIGDTFGLQTAMWLLLTAPVALLLGLPRPTRS